MNNTFYYKYIDYPKRKYVLKNPNPNTIRHKPKKYFLIKTFGKYNIQFN